MIFCSYECVETALKGDEARAVHVLGQYIKTPPVPPVPCFERISIGFRLDPLLLEKIPGAWEVTASWQTPPAPWLGEAASSEALPCENALSTGLNL